MFGFSLEKESMHWHTGWKRKPHGGKKAVRNETIWLHRIVGGPGNDHFARRPHFPTAPSAMLFGLNHRLGHLAIVALAFVVLNLGIAVLFSGRLPPVLYMPKEASRFLSPKAIHVVGGSVIIPFHLNAGKHLVSKPKWCREVFREAFCTLVDRVLRLIFHPSFAQAFPAKYQLSYLPMGLCAADYWLVFWLASTINFDRHNLCIWSDDYNLFSRDEFKHVLFLRLAAVWAMWIDV